MAKNTDTSNAETSPAPERLAGRKLANRAPYLHYKTGDIILARIDQHRHGVKSKFGPKDVTVLTLERDFTCPADKTGKVVAFKRGDVVSFDIKGGAKALQTLDVGTLVEIEVGKKVPTDKGNDAWTYEFTYV